MYKSFLLLFLFLNFEIIANGNSLAKLINFDRSDRSLQNYEQLLNGLGDMAENNNSEALKALTKQTTILISANKSLHENAKILKSKKIKVGSKEVEIIELTESSVRYIMSGNEKEASLNKIPTTFYYALLKQAGFPSYLDASFSYAAFHGDLKSTQKLHSILKKNKQQKPAHIYTYEYFSKQKEIIKTGKLLTKVPEQIFQDNIASANATLTVISKEISRSPIQKSLFTPEVKYRYSLIQKSLEKLKAAELQLFADFPLAAGERAKVQCLNYPEFQYDVYLPPQYKHDGSALLPIMYTFSPGGGGMVNHFKRIAQEKGIILIGNIESKNSRSYELIKNSWYAIKRDIDRRIHFEPGRQFAAGMSGGAAQTYVFSRRFYSQISGVIPMGGWLGFNTNPNDHWHLPGFKVVRTCGDNDRGAKSYIQRDKEILATHDVEIKDISFIGGHSPAPYLTQVNAIDWLLEKCSIAKDQQEADQFYLQNSPLVHSQVAGSTLLDCLMIMRQQAYTWTSFKARKLYEEILFNHGKNISSFKKHLSKVTMDRLTIDTFGEDLYAAALVGDHQTFWACLTILEEQNALDLHLKTAAWHLSQSKNDKIRDRKKARQLLDAKKKLSLDETIVKAALEITENNEAEFLKLKKEIDSRITAREEKYRKSRYEEVMKLSSTL